VTCAPGPQGPGACLLRPAASETFLDHTPSVIPQDIGRSLRVADRGRLSSSLLCRVCWPTVRDRRRIMQATAVAAALSGAPSTLDAFRHQRDFRSVVTYVWEATCAVGTLVPPGRPGFIRGALLHVGISVLCGVGLARTVPESRSVIWGAGAGLAIGVINLAVIGRRFPAVAALPLVPQLADNVAFGVLFALVVDR
jgi:hypothetical protein